MSGHCFVISFKIVWIGVSIYDLVQDMESVVCLCIWKVCADPESFARGGENLITFLFS